MPENEINKLDMNYLRWEGFHKFICKGRIMLGPNPIAPILIFIVINISSIILICFPLVYYVEQGNPFCIILCLLMMLTTNIFEFLTVFTDPGNIPMIESKNTEVLKTNFMINNASMIKLKYCYTCHIIRPPRAVHCCDCGCCIERMDHHCPWLGCCIGKRNYAYFIIFIDILTIYCITGTVIFATYCADFTKKLKSDLNKETSEAFGEAMKRSPLTLPMILCGSITSCFLFLLCYYHLKLLIIGKTTHEDIKEHGYKIHPFDRLSIINNIWQGLCVPKGTPKFKPREKYLPQTIEYPEIRNKTEEISKVRHSVSEISKERSSNISNILISHPSDRIDCIEIVHHREYSYGINKFLKQRQESEYCESTPNEDTSRYGDNVHEEDNINDQL